MKRYLFALLLFCFQVFGQEFSLIRSDKKNELWKIDGKKASYIALTKKKIDFQSNKLLTSSDLFQKIVSDKKKILKLMGISSWNVERKDFKKMSQGELVSFNGTYLDRSSTKIYYTEKHLFTGGTVIQLLYTSPFNEISLYQDALMNKLLTFGKKERSHE